MGGSEAFRYDGKRTLVVGGATGMGAAAAHTVAALGGATIVMDYSPVEYQVAEAIKVDVRDRAAVDEALDQVTGPIDAVFLAAGVADGTEGLMKVNFIAHRHIVDRLLERGQLGRGSAICMISSIAGLSWESVMPQLKEFLDTPDYEAAVAWVGANAGSDTYSFSKRAMNCYVARQAFPFMQRGVRINAVCPGPTDTPLARANADLWLAFAQDYRDATGTEHLTPEQIGNAMVLLNSDAASGISGVSVLVDHGHVMSSFVGSYAPGRMMAKTAMGRG